MKMTALLAAAASIVALVGCGSDIGEGPNPVPEPAATAKAPTTDFAHAIGETPFVEPGIGEPSTGPQLGPTVGAHQNARPRPEQ